MYPAWFQSIFEPLSSIGLNVIGVADGSPYQAFLANCHRAIVFANGGTALWESFIEDIKSQPKHLRDHQHPFDDFVHRMIQAADPTPNKNRRWIRCAAEPELFLDFRPLAHAAGLGFQSQMGLLIHPVYGLWIGLRAVLLTTEDLPLTPMEAASPCHNCDEKPCATACPAGAVKKGGWDVKICAQHHRKSRDCHGRCHSRLACPIGLEHRHGALQHLYHNARGDGRRALAASLQICDTLDGIDPPWYDWT
ncbi:MAG: hypothetical protein VX278_24175 [Myxococcota bacterium]|nr:hypothetical protein [Myxococcota bacterium]